MSVKNDLLTEQALRKWKPVLDHSDMAPITDPHRRAITATLLENQEKAIKEQMLNEALPANYIGGGISNTSGEGNIKGYDPILIQLVRRAMPNLMAYDVCGVQAMSAPTGLIFAMRSRYATQTGTEAFYNEPVASYSGSTSNTVAPGVTTSQAGGGAQATNLNGWNGLSNLDPFGYGAPGLDPRSASGLTTGSGLQTQIGEDATPNNMAFSIERVAVQAATRTLAASYSVELAQDLKAVHGLDAETELANILSTEILAEINREVVRNIYRTAKLGAQQPDLYYKGIAGGLTTAGNGTAYGGVYNLIQDSDGRWSAEKFRGLMFQIERECNQIAKDTRRGKGNFIICSADVASALAMGGFLNLSPALNVNLDIDDTGNTFAGTLNGKIKVYIDPYQDVSGTTNTNFICVGYKGTSPYDAGLFYCPYVPLQMMRAVDTANFQPKIAFKTRYGMVANPFAEGANVGFGALNTRSNLYYRIFRVDDLHGVAS